MGHKNNSGFTIIEVSFFLAISGLMAVGLLAGAGASINTQMYKDSAVSLRTQLQHEVTRVENIENSRDGSQACNSNGVISPNSTAARGTTDCVLLGRYVAVQSNTIKASPVVAHPTVNTRENLDDIAYLKSYNLNVDAARGDTTNSKWGNSIVYPKSFAQRGSPRDIYFLIVRSPKSGGLYLFSSGVNSSDNLRNMVRQEASNNLYGRTQQILCIKKDGIVASSNLGVVVEANLSSASDIRTLSSDTEPEC